ncbi:Paramyosin like [Actinidia chinensis var. chinensis]|uniref:Paramyosin like n=1 Tax=Actinidia chinensis var. chinensis TaxID=1590841 RepID=A0A2R6RQN2_ACTCC|nr:Paramyosin like [Actinidia chinensis var. chinensis]
MDEKGAANSYLVAISEDKSESLYPMFFGVSCAFFALRLVSEPEMNDERLLEVRNGLLQGSAHLLGLLVWSVRRVQADSGKGETLHKLQKVEKEIEEFKRMRKEDAKANEKVVGIFAAQEQSWFSHRKKLRQQIGALMNELRVMQTKSDEVISELNDKLQEKDQLLQSKDKLLELEGHKRKGLEEKLLESKNVVEELRETSKREAKEHSSELWKHKTAFIELVSNQRQLEAEMGRALRQVESTKRELDSVLMQKEESVLMAQKLSAELIKTRKDLEQKDKILSAMLRKSKMDTAEKQMLLKEVKLSKAKRKQAELETERWRVVSESRRERNSLKNMLSKHSSSNATVPSHSRNRSQSEFLIEYEQSGHQKEPEVFSPLHDQNSHEGSEDLVFAADVKQLEGWVRSEAEKYNTLVEQRHHLEINAFAEQLRLKDEKLEAFQWSFLSMELESKRLQSHVEGLNHDLSQLRQENMRLGALVLDREVEMNSLKQQLQPPIRQKTDLNSNSHNPSLGHETIWSQVKIVKKKPGEKEHETKAQEVEPQVEEETTSTSQSRDIVLPVQSPEKEFEKQKDVALDPGSIQLLRASPEEVDIVEKSAVYGQCLSKSSASAWKMDLHALGVSYKIKRLKQLLLMLERLTGKRESVEDGEDGDNASVGIKGLHILISLLNKQVSRYQALQGKTDELCTRMHDIDLDVSCGGSRLSRTKEETKTLEHFLEETLHLQRYMVATGQKLMEIQSKIAFGFAEAGEELDGSASFDMKQFADSVRTLFRDVQRGLEVRIARIIGDLEGTLARDGMIHLRN